ncbi:HAMP domain-containing histidine kinase [Dehalococcoidia bacterium]|nr:HAMP domain-containing histidine kinase [Dehalococcoidia bacterium]
MSIRKKGDRFLEGHEYVVFGFADNAFGVPDELKTRLFDPFFTTREPGLGLSIAYSIVTRALGGKIWVEDSPAGGASFKVALPLGEAPCASTS